MRANLQLSENLNHDICGLPSHRSEFLGELGGHSESLRPSDMGSVQNLIGMPSNGYVPKVAVQNTIAIYNFFFKKNIWAKHWWRILYFNHCIDKWFKNIVNHFALPSIWSFTLLFAVTFNMGQQCPLAGSFFTSSFPQFWNPLGPWLQRYSLDGNVNTHFQILAEPLLAGFWQRCFYYITYYQV